MPRRPRTEPKKQAKQDRSRATVDAILTATSRILVQVGYDKTSTTRIAAKAGISVGSLYQYFPGKEAIVAELIDRHMRVTFDLFRAELAAVAGAPVRVAVRTMIEVLFRAYAVDPALHRVFVEQVPRIGRLQRIRELDSALTTLTATYLRAHAAELAITDCDVAAFVITRSVAAVAYSTIIQREAPKPDAMIDEIAKLVSSYLGIAHR